MKTLTSYLAAGMLALAAFATASVPGAASAVVKSLNDIGLATVQVVTAMPDPALYVMQALGLGALSFMRRKPSI
jgi:energy-converting hydrogenase Eha subunit E